jgi:uncharacterized membrane protein YgcG
MRRIEQRVRHGLVWGAIGTLVLPVAIALTAGLGALLRSLDDPTAAAACGWIALALAIVWLTAVVATTALSALAVAAQPRPRRGGRGRFPGRRRGRMHRRGRFRAAGYPGPFRQGDGRPGGGGLEPGDETGSGPGR